MLTNQPPYTIVKFEKAFDGRNLTEESWLFCGERSTDVIKTTHIPLACGSEITLNESNQKLTLKE